MVMLLMDTRESRWLPTLLCRLHSKVGWNGVVRGRKGGLGFWVSFGELRGEGG